MLLSIPEGHGVIYGIILYGMGILILAMIIRMVASWVNMDERYAFIRFLAKITDPFVTPLRRVIPPIGVFDVAFLIAWFLLMTIQILLTQALPMGW